MNTARTILLFVSIAVSLGPGAAAHGQPEDGTSLAEAVAIAEELTRVQRDPVAAALERAEMARERADDAQAALLSQARAMSLSSEESVFFSRPAAFEQFADAVNALARRPDGRALPLLGHAALHGDPEVRHAAMTALREGASAGRPGSSALLTARRLVLSDPSPRVRRQAFEAYCRWGSQDDVLALSQALGREPGPVRDLAVREWIRLEREGGLR